MVCTNSERINIGLVYFNIIIQVMVFHTKKKRLQKLKFKTHLTGFGGTMLKRMGACVAVYPIETVSSICMNWKTRD